MSRQAKPNLGFMLTALTLLLLFAQGLFFFVHYKVSDIADALASAAIWPMLFVPSVFVPLLTNVLLQLFAYLALIIYALFITRVISELIQLSIKQTYCLGLMIWLVTVGLIIGLNAYYFPDSYFATWLSEQPRLLSLLIKVCGYLSVVYALAGMMGSLYYRINPGLGIGFMLLALCLYAPAWLMPHGERPEVMASQPNVILIGLDSLRPDQVSYFTHRASITPNVDKFLNKSVVFSQAYTPLARTFPSWVSILTAKYPLHSKARANLTDPVQIMSNDTIAKRLQAQGYYTIYATDESRFSNIRQGYGFNRVIGPAMGAPEFLIAGLNDFPLVNLLATTPAGEYLFPYQYANRAASLTYRPERFMHLLAQGIAKRPDNKPVMLAVHLCLSHWPFRFARDGVARNTLLYQRYQQSVAAVDKQFADLLQLLKQQGLLQHSIVVLLSDHGVTLGMRGDRVITEDRYQGNPALRPQLAKSKLAQASEFTTNFKRDYSVTASYGQGTDALSLKQYHVLLAFRGFGVTLPIKQEHSAVSLLDIAPTLLDYLQLPPLSHVDGISLAGDLHASSASAPRPRAVFIETGDRISETETSDVQVEQVVKQAIASYEIDETQGLLSLNPPAVRSMVANKQRAILWQDWLLVHYPPETHYYLTSNDKDKTKLVLKSFRSKPFWVLANTRTGDWTIDVNSAFARQSPLATLRHQLLTFYGQELTSTKR